MEDNSIEQKILIHFINEFAVPYFRACILIENFTNQEYAPFYKDILKYFGELCKDKDAFDGEKYLKDTYHDFRNAIEPYVNGIVSRRNLNVSDLDLLQQHLDSEEKCEEVLIKLRELEEY